jgi:hypothetical protein
MRLLIWSLWLLLTLIVVAGPVWAQGDGNNPTTTGDQVAPENLDDIAVKLTPLVVGAAIIERTLELLFTWVERAVLDVYSGLHKIASRVTGLVQVDMRHAWDQVQDLTSAMTAKAAGQGGVNEDPNSPNPVDWPLAVLEARMIDAKLSLGQAESNVKAAMDSPLYTSRKKILAGFFSLLMGVLLAAFANLRLFQPIGVRPSDNIKGVFDGLDLVMAGILMGLGTDWVHQIIGLLIQGKGLLGRAAGGNVDAEQIRSLAAMTVQQELQAQIRQLKVEAVDEAKDLAKDVKVPPV